jgi:hypothetical protein
MDMTIQVRDLRSFTLGHFFSDNELFRIEK